MLMHEFFDTVKEDVAAIFADVQQAHHLTVEVVKARCEEICRIRRLERLGRVKLCLPL